MNPNKQTKGAWNRRLQVPLDGQVTVRRQTAPQLCTTATICRGVLVEPMEQVGRRVGVEASSDSSFVDAQGITIFGKLRDGMEVFITGCAISNADTTEDNDGYCVCPPDVSVAWAYDPRVLEHVPAADRTPENPYRLRRAVEALLSDPRAHEFLPEEMLNLGQVSPQVRGEGKGPDPATSQSCGARADATPMWIAPRMATTDEIALCHNSQRYRRFIENGIPLPQPLKTDVYCNGETSNVAVRLSVGAVVDAARRALNGDPPFAFCLVRPPGHHASADTPAGFCLVNNVAIAAMQILEDWRVGNEGLVPSGINVTPQRPRIAIVDVDVHHGEGTQSFVEVEPNLLYLSVHRYDYGAFYPRHTGGATSYVGPLRNICNVAVNTAATNQERCEEVISDMLFARVVDNVFLPRLVEFRPDIILLSLGFDAAYGDPLGKMAVEGGFAYVVRALKQFCLQPRSTIGLVAVLEGGYSPEGVSRGVVSVAHALCYPFDDEVVVSYARLHTPKTWQDLRSRLSRRKQSQTREANEVVSSTSGHSGAGCREWASGDVSLPEDDVLMERHLGWCDRFIKRVLAIHSEANRTK